MKARVISAHHRADAIHFSAVACPNGMITDCSHHGSEVLALAFYLEGHNLILEILAILPNLEKVVEFARLTNAFPGSSMVERLPVNKAACKSNLV